MELQDTRLEGLVHHNAEAEHLHSLRDPWHCRSQTGNHPACAELNLILQYRTEKCGDRNKHTGIAVEGFMQKDLEL